MKSSSTKSRSSLNPLPSAASLRGDATGGGAFLSCLNPLPSAASLRGLLATVVLGACAESQSASFSGIAPRRSFRPIATSSCLNPLPTAASLRGCKPISSTRFTVSQSASFSGIAPRLSRKSAGMYPAVSIRFLQRHRSAATASSGLCVSDHVSNRFLQRHRSAGR